MKRSLQARKAQQGITAVVVTIAMLAIVGTAGMALDVGRMYRDRTQLQNALDAAALAGAKAIDQKASTATARTQAQAVFATHASGDLASAGTPTVEFSATYKPFTPGASDATAKYVRVRTPSLQVPMLLARVVPGVGNNRVIAATAVAGPSASLTAQACDIAPITACGTPGDSDCSDGSCFGYQINTTTEQQLKAGSNTNNATGPGNYQLVNLDCGNGAACVRTELAGGYDGCASTGDSLTVKPGNTVGPVAQGFNTRFNQFTGPMNGMQSTYPPDTVTTNISPVNKPNTYWYSNYTADQRSKNFDVQPVPSGFGVPMRRVLTVPIVNCSTATNGAGTVSVIGFGCFFMTRPAEQNGDQRIFGQFVSGCRVDGVVSQVPTNNGMDVHKIVLYKDPDASNT